MVGWLPELNPRPHGHAAAARPSHRSSICSILINFSSLLFLRDLYSFIENSLGNKGFALSRPRPKSTETIFSEEFQRLWLNRNKRSAFFSEWRGLLFVYIFIFSAIFTFSIFLSYNNKYERVTIGNKNKLGRFLDGAQVTLQEFNSNFSF